MTTDLRHWFLAGTLSLAMVAGVPAAFADGDRMAGKVHGTSHNQKQESVTTLATEDGQAPSAAPADAEDGIRPESNVHAVQKVDFTALESHGLISTSQDGALGSDLWRGTSRALLVEKIPDLPGLAEYRTLQQLTLRALLTRGDAGLMKRDSKPEPGADLTTIRIEKLLEMGAFEQALSLYMQGTSEPYHERFARAGVFAAFYNRESALACLEEKSMEKRFEDVSFWQQLAKICSYVLTKGTPASARAVADKIEFPESKVLQNVVKKENFRFKVSRYEDLQSLTPLEAAVLTGLGRFDFSSLKTGALSDLPPHVLAVISGDPSLPEDDAFALVLHAVETGMRSVAELDAYYEKKAVEHFGKDKANTSLAHFITLSGWRRLPYLHRAALNTTEGPARIAVLRKALAIAPEFGAAALWPLAGPVAALDPATLSPGEVRTGFRIIAESGTQIPDSWAQAWRENNTDEPGALPVDELLLFLAFNLGTGIPLKNDELAPDTDKEKESSLPHGLLMASSAYEKLDKSLKLHNYGASKGYENPKGLTSGVDYVMPSSGLLDALDKAEYEQRLGEVILLSSVALRGVPPQELSVEAFSEVIGGLVTVGLTNEARSLAREVLLGLSI